MTSASVRLGLTGVTVAPSRQRREQQHHELDPVAQLERHHISGTDTELVKVTTLPLEHARNNTALVNDRVPSDTAGPSGSRSARRSGNEAKFMACHSCRAELAGEELDLVAHQCFEGLAEVEVEMAGVVAFDLTPGAVRAYRRVWAGGVTLSVLLTQNRIGNLIFFARTLRAGRPA